ncbi:amino acid adenylation domain-containing protein [Streptomyces sp. NPDC053367]|uniref:amino acid adenylation domain-containing protein n=1 Tax=Streptomyces sp. NPDC053367 TaxID=3365700 RepID=UPI0037D2BBF6
MSAHSPDTLLSLLDDLAKAGVRLRAARGGGLEISAPKGRLDDGLRARLVAGKQDLVDWLARQSDGSAAAPGQLPRVVPDPGALHEPFQPSDLQMSFLVGSRDGVEYHVRPHQYMEYDLPDADPERMQRALDAELAYQRNNLVVVRPDMRLETVRDPAPARVRVYDLRELSAAGAEERVARIRASMYRKEPVHDRWPWVDLRMSLLPGGGGKLHYNNNNLFSDAPSTLRFLQTVLRRYREPDYAPPELEISYRDCVLALAELERSPLGEASRRYWEDRIPDWPEAPAVPLAQGADPRRRSKLVRREMLFPAPVWAALGEQAARRNLTTTNVLCAIHAEVLAYWSGSRHFLLNNMITHRLPLHPRMSEVLGNFASLYPLEVDWRPEEPFHARVRRLQQRVLADVEHVYWSGVKVLQAVNRARRTPGKAVCPFAVGSALFVGQAERPVDSLLETPSTLIDCEFWDLKDGTLWVIWDVIEDMFPPGLIDAMESGYRHLVEELARGDAAWEKVAFDLLPREQARRRAELNAPAGPVPEGLLTDPLPVRAAERGGRAAVVTAEGTLTYAELRDRAAALTSALRAAGVRPRDRVAVTLPKGMRQAVAVLGVLGAGAAYVPLSPEWPDERLRYVLRDTGAAAWVTDEPLRQRLAGLGEAPVITVDATDTGTRPVAAEHPGISPSDLAYIIYTSGSTGRPKGAMLDHRGPVNTIRDINERFGITAEDVVYGVSSLSFDLSVYDVFGSLDAGATLVLPEPGDPDPAAWLRDVRTHGVTVWNSVPALMELFTEEAEAAGVRCPSLRTVLLSGDWIPVGLPDRIRAIAPNARVVGLGGATEASIWSICHPVDAVDPAWVSIPYGRPLANQTWYVLDELGRDVPDWVPGQLYIGGAGVALGYWGDPEKTAASFVTHPRTGERLYRTGDLGRYLPDGNIEFLGRCDFQVKINGFRVEPGEVEHALLECPGVAQAAVVAHRGARGNQLTAFVAGPEDAERPLVSAALREELTERLPAYLVPAQVVVLDRLPLTGNGKLDRAALQAAGPQLEDARAEFTPPATPTERTLAELWSQLLDTDRVGLHDDFFELGGQSYTALRMMGQIAHRFGVRPSLGTIMEHPTVAELASWLDAHGDETSPLVRLGDGDGDDSGRPWFLVHPAGGGVLCYRELARRLGTPCYGLQAPGPADGQRPLDDVGELASLYVRALLKERPSGPYRIGGWSSGAVVAAEMARLLEERGAKVERLLVIDCPAPLQTREIDDVRLLLWFLEDLGVGFDPARVGERDLTALAALPPEERLGHALSLLEGPETARRLPSREELADVHAVFEGVVRACNRHRAEPVAADITVVRATDGTVGEFAGHPCADLPDWGWSRLTTGVVSTAAVTGTHHTLLGGAALDVVAAAADGRTAR